MADLLIGFTLTASQTMGMRSSRLPCRRAPHTWLTKETVTAWSQTGECHSERPRRGGPQILDCLRN
jgi:hypothetical protein